MVVLTIKAALAPVQERLAAAEQANRELSARVVELTALRDRLTTVETKALAPATGPSPAELELMIRNQIAPVLQQAGALSERLAVLDARAPIPGPPGKDGANGQNGKDGADGFGFDELVVEQTGDRQFAIKGIRGDRVKQLGIATFPVQIQRGVWLEGKSYEQGDVVTWGGSSWHCNETTTTRPGDGSKAWTLVVKRGRDGKDGKDGEGPLPLVAVK
jgi:hypothetical protein